MRDILLDDSGDLDAENGDFVIGESNEQHVESILSAAQGVWKQFPLVGVNISKKTKMPTTHIEREKFRKNIKLQLEYDQFNVFEILFSNNDIIIDCDKSKSTQ